MPAKKIKPSPTKENLPFGIGSKILIRTVTMIQVGEVTDIGKDYIVLKDCSWIADTGRFSECIQRGTVKEVEECGSWMYVGRGAIVDLHPWDYPLPVKTN